MSDFHDQYDVKPRWLSSFNKPLAIRYLAFVLMFAGIGSAVMYTRAATAAHPIKGFGDACLSAGSPVQLRNCDSGSSQNWQYSQDGSLEQNGQCLDIDRDSGVSVKMAPCDDSKYQRWHQDDNGALINLANASCLQAAVGGEAGGPQSLITSACSSGPAQRWDTGR